MNQLLRSPLAAMAVDFYIQVCRFFLKILLTYPPPPRYIIYTIWNSEYFELINQFGRPQKISGGMVMSGRIVSVTVITLFCVFFTNSLGITSCIPGVNCVITNVRDACENDCQVFETDCQIKIGGSPGDECEGSGKKCIERVWKKGTNSTQSICNYNLK